MGRLRLALLGPLEIWHADQRLTLSTHKAEALLVYLAVEGGLHSRERLATLLWPESDEERARGSLRSNLNFLRAGLPHGTDSAPHLTSERGLLGLDPSSGTELDLNDVEAAYHLARTASGGATDDELSLLRRAIGCSRGAFLEGFSVPDAPDFELWLVVRRESWRARVAVIFDRLSLALSQGGELEQAVAVTTRWVEHNPLNEAAYRRLMRLHSAAGDTEAALGAYRTCRATLARELSADPSAETRALAAALRRAPRPDEQRQDDGPAIPLVNVDAPLIGRVAEHTALTEALRAARHGTPRIVAVEGEAGIGKTRLVTDFLRWATAHGADTLEGHTLATGTALPYQVLIEALRPRLETIPDLDQILSAVWLGELSILLPELRDRFPALPAPATSGDDQGASRLYEAVTRVVQTLADRAPVILFLDDLQWVDAGSLDLLRYAIRRWANASTPLLLVCTQRLEESPKEVGSWFSDVARDVPLTRLPLAALTQQQALRLASAAGLRSAGNWLFTETGGHPFYLVQTVRALHEQGLLRPAGDGDWTIAAERLHELVVPGVRDVMLNRISRLSSTARVVLTAAAVLGDGAATTPLAHVAARDEEALLAAVDELLARRLLRESGSGYRFGHDKIREVVYAEAGEARRRAFHRRAFEALASRRTPAAGLARHAVAAGLQAQAFRWSVTAGDDALRLFAVRDAIGHYERALAVYDDAAPGEAIENWSAHAALLARLGRAHELIAAYPQAREVYEAMLAMARQRNDAVHICDALNALAALTANDVRLGQDRDLMAVLLREALTLAEASMNRPGVARTEWNLSRLSLYRNDFMGAQEHAQRSLTLARELDDHELIARCLNWLAISSIMVSALDNAHAYADEAARRYREMGDRAMEIDSLVQIAASQNRLGRPHNAITAARSALVFSEEIDHAWGVADSARELGLALLECGEYGTAQAMAQRSRVAGRIAGHKPLMVMVMAVLGMVERRLGMHDEALATHEELWSIATDLTHPMFIELAAAELCATHAVHGDWAEAARWADRALASRSPGFPFFGATRPYEAAALLHSGRHAEAVADLQAFGARAMQSPRYQLSYLRALAALAAWEGDTAGTIHHLESARLLAETGGLLGEQWEIMASLAQLYRGHEDATRATSAEKQAAQLLATLAGSVTDERQRTHFLNHARSAACFAVTAAR